MLKVDLIIRILKMLYQDEISMTFCEPIDDEKLAQLCKDLSNGSGKVPAENGRDVAIHHKISGMSLGCFNQERGCVITSIGRSFALTASFVNKLHNSYIHQSKRNFK